jgi:hypothetical protein
MPFTKINNFIWYFALRSLKLVINASYQKWKGFLFAQIN